MVRLHRLNHEVRLCIQINRGSRPGGGRRATLSPRSASARGSSLTGVSNLLATCKGWRGGWGRSTDACMLPHWSARPYWIYVIVLCCFNLGLLFFGTYCAFLARHIASKFIEAKWVFLIFLLFLEVIEAWES